MNQKQISSISEFLLHAGTDYRVFDMGRSIRTVDSQTFLEIENGQRIASFPRLQHAWFGVVFWDKTRSHQHFIWFIKLPLDEQGKVVSATRNHFLQIIIDALGMELENAEAKNGQLPENPYTFVPNQQQLADFNSISRQALELGHSSHYAQAQRYLATPLVIDWQQVALQGLSDAAARINQTDTLHTISSQWSHYPQAVQFSLATSLENQPLNNEMLAQIASWMKTQKDPLVWQHGLRALCQSQSANEIQQLIDHALSCELSEDQGVLLVIAGRLWQQLKDSERLLGYFERVAKADPQYGLFQGIFSDLVQQPALREECLMMLRSTEKSVELTQAVGSLFSQLDTRGQR